MPLEETTVRLPSIKRPAEGELIIGMAVDLKKNLPRYVFGSNPPQQATNAKGQPATQDCLTILVLEGTRARAGDGAATVGELAQVWLAGGDRWSWGEARDRRGGQLLDIGDIVKWKLDKMEPSTTGGFPRKVTKFAIESPTAEQAALVAQAKKLHDMLRGGTAIEDAPAGAGYNGNEDEAF